MFGSRKSKEVSFSPGRLARRIGMGKSTLIKHLKDNGLYPRCFRDANGWLRIPYDVAIELAGPEALTIDMPKRKKKPKRISTQKNEMDEFVAEIMGDDYEVVPERPPNFVKPSSEQIARERVEKRLAQYRNIAVQMFRIGITPQQIYDYYQTQGG